MKVKQLIFMGIAVGGIIVFILAGLGFLTSRQLPSSSPDAPEWVEGDASIQVVVDNVQTEGPGWKLSAESAVLSEDMGYKLFRPVLEITDRPSDDPKEKRDVTVIAEAGSQKSLHDPLVKLSGDVRVEVKSAHEDALLTADSLAVDLDNNVATTESPVVFKINREGGENVITGRKVQFDFIAQTLRIEEEVRLALAGAPGLLTTSQAQGQEPEGKNVLVTCEGGLLYEGMLHRVSLMRDVRARSGEDTLRADTLEVYFSPEDQSVRKTVARGNVLFAGPMGKASADKFVQSGEGGILLTGSPRCFFERGTYRIEGAHLEINPRLGTISVPGPGSLEGMGGTGEEASNGEGVKVSWKGGLLFDQKSHLAIIKQDVVALQPGYVTKCESLVIRFTDDNRDILELEASEDAVIIIEVPAAGERREKPKAESSDTSAEPSSSFPESD